MDNIQKEKLIEIKNELEERILRLEKPKKFGDDVDGFEEDADEVEEMSGNLAILSSLRERLSRVENALVKINDGSYGICEKCKEQIGEEMLSVDPESQFCRNCKISQKK